MPICISCSTPVRNLYTTYSKADDRSLGKGVRLTQCPRCKRFADKYVEHDFVVLFIDLVLIKPQVYRHLLFNRLGQTETESGDGPSDGETKSNNSSNTDKLDPSIVRLGILLILFDVYLTWARIERTNHSSSKPNPSSSPSSSASGVATLALADTPILAQYLFFLTMNVMATVAQHATIRALVRFFSFFKPRHDPNSPHPDLNPPPSGSSITTALLISSCGKLFPILLVIWPTSSSSSSSSIPVSSQQQPAFSTRARTFIDFAVLLNNLEALLILLDCGYPRATALAVAGALARWGVEGLFLTLAGLDSSEHHGLGGVLDWFWWVVGSS